MAPLFSLRVPFGWLIVGVLLAASAHAEVPTLHRFNSRAYNIQTNLSRREVRPFADHMDKVFAAYRQRFEGFRARDTGDMPLILLRTRQQYMQYMQRRDVNAKNSGGMFFVLGDESGLVTWTADRPRSKTFEVLQHEGFHQFAHNYLGRRLPIWINEGLAEYFQDAVVVGRKMEIGLADARRIQIVKNALRDGDAVRFSELINIDHDQWRRTLRTAPKRATLLYAQSWSVVYFLIHGDDQKYQSAFNTYLNLVSRGKQSRAAFQQAFGVESLAPAADRWRAFAKRQQPDALNVALTRLQFLGRGLRYLHERDEPLPDSLAGLKRELQRRSFRLTYKSHAIRTTYRAKNDQLYRFTRDNGSTGAFELLEASRNDLPPRITARGLRPQPMLVWSRNEEGELVQDVRFR